MSFPEDPFIKSLVARLIQPGVVGIALAGSYSRGTQDQLSDVDMELFVESLPDETYMLRIMDGKLVSLKYMLLQDEYDSLTKPERSIWAVPGLQQMQILVDESGQLANLKQTAFDFNWIRLQNTANEFAVDNLMGCAEEVHKIISGLSQDDESKVLYAVLGLFHGLVNAVAVQRGLMMESENRYFDVIQKSMQHFPDWTHAFRLVLGAEVDDVNISVYKTRGQAALKLYKQTAHLFEDIIPDKHRDVIENTLQLIKHYEESKDTRPKDP